MKYAGILLMASSAALAGFFAAQSYKERLEILLVFRKMAYYMKGQILYSNAALPETLAEVGRRSLEENRGICKEPGLFFCRAARRLDAEPGAVFSRVWREEADRFPKDFPMTEQDRNALYSLGENLGYAGREMQERTILFYLEQTDGAIALLREEMDGKLKLYRSLGVAAGLFLLILLI